MSSSRRSAVVDRALADRGAEALVILASHARDPDLAPFVGPVHMGRSFLVWPQASAPRLGYVTSMEREEAAATGLATLSPQDLEINRLLVERPVPGQFWAGIVVSALRHLAIPPGRLALAGHLNAGLVTAIARGLEAEGWVCVDGSEVARLARKVKEAGEIEALRSAARGTVAAFRRVAELLAAAVEASTGLVLAGEPLTVGRLRREVMLTLADHGLEQPQGNILAPGRDAGIPHSAGHDDQVLRAGEPLVMDIYPKGVLFADCTRTFCVGTPTEPLAAAHAAVLEALRRSHRACLPGVRGFSLQEDTCRFFRELGYATILDDPATTSGYVHHLGHGVGSELHEYPSFRKEAGEEGVLAVGDAITLEPGLYDPDAGWGVRLEDLVVLWQDGPENLTPLPYELDPRAWPAG